ncbi:MAG: hypothetical protein ACRDD8_03945 [Bacteroidales bacterium]
MDKNILKVDINTLVSENIKAELREKDTLIAKLYNIIDKKSEEISEIKKQNKLISDNTIFTSLYSERWSKLSTKDAKLGFFYDIFKSLDIQKTNTDLSYRDNMDILTYLSYEYYDHRDILKNIVDSLADNTIKYQPIKKLGRDFSKEEIINTLQTLIITNTRDYVLAYTSDTFPNKIAFSELFRNKHILDADVMEIIFNNIKTMTPIWQWLLYINQYTDVDDATVNKLFECIDFEYMLDKRVVQSFFTRSFESLTSDNQSILLDLYGIQSNHYTNITKIEYTKESALYKYLNNIEINAAILKLKSVMYPTKLIIKYVVTERVADAANIKEDSNKGLDW